jgi:hypothetical protein
MRHDGRITAPFDPDIAPMYWNVNAQALKHAHPGTANWLEALAQTPAAQDAQLLQTAAGDFSLYYRGTYLHSLNGAVREAGEATQKGCKPAIGRAHLIMGLGLGYLLEAVYQRSPGNIVVYEPDLSLLKFVLENVDLSEYLASGRVYLTTDTSETLSALHPFIACEDPLDVLALPGQAQRMSREIPPFMEALFQWVEDRVRNYKTGLHFHQQWTRQFFENLPYFAQVAPFSTLKAQYEGKPALIIGRGPSLDRAIPELAALADSVTLIATGSTLHRLHQADITPDIAVFYDPNGMQEQLHGLPEAYLRHITFCISPFTQSAVFAAPSCAKVLCFPQSGEAFAQWLAESKPQAVSPTEALPVLTVEGGGTVSLIAMQIAQALHSSQIILIGQDLAFPNNQAYAGGIAVQQDEQGRLALNKRDNLFTAPEAMTTVTGQDGQSLPALKAYASFIRHFEKLAVENARQPQPTPLYNASLGGAAIQGYELKPLSDFLGIFKSCKPISEEHFTNQQPNKTDKAMEALRYSLSHLQQAIREAIRLHEATLTETKPNAQQSANQTLFDFLNRHPLISHFLMFEMMSAQQRYNPNAALPEEITANQALLRQNTLNCIEILKNEILPQVITAERRLETSLHSSAPCRNPG